VHGQLNMLRSGSAQSSAERVDARQRSIVERVPHPPRGVRCSPVRRNAVGPTGLRDIDNITQGILSPVRFTDI